MPTTNVPLNVTLTNDEWVEVVAALDTKITYVQDDHYGEDNPGDNVKWVATLKVAKIKIAEALHKAGFRC